MSDALEEARAWAQAGEDHALLRDEGEETTRAFTAAAACALISIAESLERMNQKT